MAVFLFANNAHTTLAGPIATGATSLTLAAGTGALFPNPAVGQQFELTLTGQSSQTVREITYCTARNGDICTVSRGQEGTTPLAFIAGDFADNFLTAGTTTNFIQATQLQLQAGNYGIDTGTTNNVVVAFNPAFSSLVQMTGAPLRIRINATNTGATTLTANGLAATTITDLDGSALNPGELVAGSVAEIVYSGGIFQLLTPNLLTATNVWAASNTFNNLVATNAALGGITFFSPATTTAGNNTYYTIIGGVSGTIINNHADNANNLTLTDTGDATFRGSITSGPIASTGAISSNTGNITAGGGRLRALLGAFGTGDPDVATILGDFYLATFVNSSNALTVVTRLPNGVILQGGPLATPVPIDNAAHTYNLAQPFTVGGFVIVQCGAFSPLAGAMMGAQLISTSQFSVTVASVVTGGTALGTWYFAMGI